MAMRLSGLMSGMDTESIIKQLVASRQAKVDTTKKAQTKLSWKQDAWKELNTKLQNLQKKYLSNMRFADAYSKKVTKVSNESVVSVITGENAVDGVQTVRVDQMAKRGYLTGAEMKGKDGKLTALSKLSDIQGFSGDGGTINIKTGSKSVDINVTGDTTISDVLTQLKSAGLNASFDEKQQRLFVSSKESGEANDFSITAVGAGADVALSVLGLKVNLSDDAATLKAYQEYAKYYVEGDKAATLDKMESQINAMVNSRTNSYLDQYKSLTASRAENQKKLDDLKLNYGADLSSLKSVEEYDKELEDANKKAEELAQKLTDESDPDKKAELDKELEDARKDIQDIAKKRADAVTRDSAEANVKSAEESLKKVNEYVDIKEVTDNEGNVTYTAAAKDKLKDEVNDYYYNKAAYAAEVTKEENLKAGTATGATKVNAQDAVIYLNEARFTNTDNTFEINGLTITALNESKENVTLSTQNDTDGIYGMIKDFLKEYNAIINEMDKLYNADSSKGYEPLTSEEKEAMSESEIAEWEKKIKDSLLRRDENLTSVSSALKSVMSSGITVNGKTMYLFDFGIETLGYFESPDNEKNAYHIAGDPDDTYTANSADKLKSMISSDPDTVVAFFSQLSKNLYDKMSDLSKSVEGYRSYGSFYDDKKMKSDYDDYKTKITDLEKKLADYEDKWYKKFAAMETAMAKMQSNTSAVTALLGGS